mgnify:CR=1 FL=1
MARKNPHAVALGRKGGKASSPAKTRAVRENARKRWAKETEMLIEGPHIPDATIERHANKRDALRAAKQDNAAVPAAERAFTTHVHAEEAANRRGNVYFVCRCDAGRPEGATP